ncbi:MAG: hypothetical protein ACK5MJ_03295 [Alphaproteobacteria bacterium]
MAAPPKILSLDICSDYYLATYGASGDIIYTNQGKDGYSLPIQPPKNAPSHKGSLEEIIQYNPDIILQTSLSYGSVAKKIQKYPFLSIKLPWATSLEQLESIFLQLNTITHGHALEDYYGKMATITGQKLTKIAKNGLLLGPNGFTIKQGTHYDIFFETAQIQNYYPDQGYGKISLEEIIRTPPDYIITITHDKNRPQLANGIFNNNILKKLNIPIFDISDSFTICPSLELAMAGLKVRKKIEQLQTNQGDSND